MQKNSSDTWAEWLDSYKKQFEGLYGIDPRLPLSQNALLQTLIASGVGAGIGAVRGGLWPGHQEEVLDKKQNIVKKKPNSALFGALTGGLIGAGSSAIANYAGQTVSEYKPELNKLLTGVLNGLSGSTKTSELKTTDLLGDSTMKKQSKVYDASESVENMPIKKTKMNHKCCTPGEFGARVKEARGQSYASNPGGSTPKTMPGGGGWGGNEPLPDHFWTWPRLWETYPKQPADKPAPPAADQPTVNPGDMALGDMALGGGIAGGGAGALLGAVLSKKKNKLRNALLGGALGAGAGALGGHYLGKMAAAKAAGSVSEYLGHFNPLNMYGGGLVGGGAALLTPTRSMKRQAEFDANDGVLRALGNVLIPGMGPYNMYKRIGAVTRSPEMKQRKARLEQEEAQKKLDALKPAETPEKEAGVYSEAFGSVLNPLSVLSAYPAGALAALTRTRTLDEQAKADRETWKNFLIPGRATYNSWKRLGAGSRAPEHAQQVADIKLKKLQEQAGVASDKPQDEEKEAASTLEDVSSYISGLYNKIPEPVRQGGGMGGVAGAALGGLSGLVAPGSKTEIGPDGKPVKKTRSRLMSAIQRAALGGVAGGAGGAAMGHFNPQLVSDIAAKRQELYDRVNPVMARDVYNPADANPARMPNNSVDVNSGPTIA